MSGRVHVHVGFGWMLLGGMLALAAVLGTLVIWAAIAVAVALVLLGRLAVGLVTGRRGREEHITEHGVRRAWPEEENQ